MKWVSNDHICYFFIVYVRFNKILLSHQGIVVIVRHTVFENECINMGSIIGGGSSNGSGGGSGVGHGGSGTGSGSGAATAAMFCFDGH